MIQIKLDKKTKIQIKGLHWLWFWKHLNDKELHLKDERSQTERILTAFQFLHEILGWEKKDFYELALGEYAKLMEYIKPTDRYDDKFKIFFEKPPSTYTFLKYHLEDGSYGPETYKKNFNDIVLECFGYETFRSGCYKFRRVWVPESVKKWCAYSLVKKLKLEVCPYCNKEYIPIIKSNKKFRAEIDHFFPKATYPYLSCSLFNLIPSCLICNHHKGKSYNIYKDGNIKLTIYPYTEGFEMPDNTGEIRNIAVFKAVPGPRGVYESKSVELKHEIQPSNDEERLLDDKITKSNDAFLIEELYNTCQTELEDLLTRHRNYAYPKIQNIMKNLSVSDDGIEKLNSLSIDQSEKDDLLNKLLCFFSKSMRNQILGIPLDSAGKEVNKEYPFRKFKKDIIEQLDDWVKNKNTGTT